LASDVKPNEVKKDSEGNFDFTTEAPKSKHISAPYIGPYDPRPQEDSARRRIAYLLIWLLWLIVLGMLLMLYSGSIEVGDLKEFGIILGPIVTLVSAATGFYYGTKSNSPNGKP
jgi:hypothetical protein